MKPLQFNDLLISFTSEFLPLWNDKGTHAHKAVGFWRPSTTSDVLSPFYALGDIAVGHYRNINQSRIVAVVSDANKADGTALRPPVDYHLVWHDEGTGAHANFSIWRPLAPQGYVTMGLVCGVGYDKPSRHAVRCVREDLIVTAQVGELIWNDKGSGSANDLSLWSVTPPDAPAGEAYLAPGTFLGHDSYAKPGTETYSLRLALTAQLSDLPPPPALTGHESPSSDNEDAATLQVCELPWFCVKDPELSAVEQLQASPTYRLERTDRHRLAGFGHNTGSTPQPFMWTADKGELGGNARALAFNTSVDLSKEWPAHPQAFEMIFSAQLGREFTHTQRSAKGWSHSSPLEIITYVPPRKAVAAYLLHSEYCLLRQDGSQVSATVSYANGDHVYMSESPDAEPLPDEAIATVEAPQAEPDLEVTGHDLIDNTLIP
ncbi:MULTISPECIES: Vps62-related protein [Pseudomonas]|uniref:Vps62-related protein n=1 Tax=Pseudomonas azadiae TaxID=2843612 RepID=A0ABS6P081_9PSED|nr:MULTISPECIES: Vps62-related protein [Pseudomonas]MBV4453871.1 Vps62-related protein [Pseudomonas azadiae]NMF40459.1 Vps62-related protein [Pseudomonas sp. SWRI 103]